MDLPSQSQVSVATPSASVIIVKSVIVFTSNAFNNCGGTHARADAKRG